MALGSSSRAGVADKGSLIGDGMQRRELSEDRRVRPHRSVEVISFDFNHEVPSIAVELCAT